MTAIDTLLSFEIDGEVDLQERGEKDEKGYWTSTWFLNAVKHDVDLTIAEESNDHDGVRIRLSTYHAEHGGRAFHMSLEAYLDVGDLRRLRRYLEFLIGDREDGPR